MKMDYARERLKADLALGFITLDQYSAALNKINELENGTRKLGQEPRREIPRWDMVDTSVAEDRVDEDLSDLAWTEF